MVTLLGADEGTVDGLKLDADGPRVCTNVVQICSGSDLFRF